MRSLRLFYALWPDDATRTALMRMQSHIRGRKTRLENLHLTLAFLGQQPADRLPVLERILADLPDAAVPLSIDRIGYFPRNRIAWAGMHCVPDALVGLHRYLTRELLSSSIGFDAAASFKPHVTLARDADAPEDFPFDPVTWQADHAALVESASNAGDVVYRVLASHRIHNLFDSGPHPCT